MTDGRLSIIVVLYRRAIAHTADLINKGILTVEVERVITSQAADTATRTIGEIMRWFGWYGVNKGDITEEESKETVAAVMEELHNLVVGVRPMLRRLGSRHPLISKVKDLKILLVNNALTVNLEEKENCVALLEEFLLTEANTDIAATAPKLTNGEKKICSLNAAFHFLLKIFPDISKNIKSSKPLSREIELVLNAAEETSLVGLKRALCAYHEEEPDYQEKSTGGMAAEAVKHLVEDFSRECGQPDYFRPFLSEELGFLSSCVRCGSNCEEVALEPSQRYTVVQVSGGVRQQVVLQDEFAQSGWVTCLQCKESCDTEASSGPRRVLLEFVGGKIWRLKGIEDKVALGGLSFQASGVCHYNQQERHFCTSVKDGYGTWWRLEDYCGSEELWRRPYLRQGETLATEEGHHRLDANVHLIMLEEVSCGKETAVVELEEQEAGAGQAQGAGGNCVDKRMCAGKDIEVGWHKCGQCNQPLCNLCSGKEDDDDIVFCFACKGGNPENPLSYKTWSTPSPPEASTAGTVTTAGTAGTGATEHAVGPNSVKRKAKKVTWGAKRDTLNCDEEQDLEDGAEQEVTGEGGHSDLEGGQVGTGKVEEQGGHPVNSRKRKPLVDPYGHPRSKSRRILDSKVEKACTLVKSGISVKKAAKEAGIWASTLRRRSENKAKAAGRPLKTLTKEEENLIVGLLQERAEMGMGLTMVQLAALLQQTLLEIKAAEPDRTTGFEASGQTPSYKFLINFRIRNQISLRKTQEMKRGRELLSLEEVRIWQAEMEKLKNSDDLREVFQDPERVWNFDETSVQWGIDGLRVLVQKNTRGSVPAKSAGTRNSTTLVVTANASGDVLPPSIVFEGKRDLSGKYIATAEKEGYHFGGQLPNISFTESGFVNTDILLSLLQLLHKHCLELKIKLPVALFLDAAPQHLSLLVIRSAQQLGIRLLLVLPNATWLLQPLDLSFFLEFKREFQKKTWDEQVASQTEGKSLNRTTILTLIDYSFKKTKVKPGLVKRGWRLSGLFPWDKDAPKLSSLKPSKKFAQRQRDVGARDKGKDGNQGDRGEGGDGPSSGIEADAATASGGSPRVREESDPSMVEGGGGEGDSFNKEVEVRNQGDRGDGRGGPSTEPGADAATANGGSPTVREENDDSSMDRREGEDVASIKQVEGARGEGGGGLSSSLARQQYLGFCNLFISPELAEQFHEQYSKGVRDSQEHLFKAYVAFRSATEVSALQAVANVCRSSIPSNLPSAARPNNRHVNGNYDLCSSEWTEKLSAPKSCPMTVATLKADLRKLGLSTMGTKVQFTS